jgi:hypothetical protein
VTTWEPGKRFAYRTDPGPDGASMTFDYIIEGRDGGGTSLRLVHSGFLGDDWEAEYDALSEGDGMYLKKLATYLTHFPGRTSTANMFAPGPQVAGADQVWAAVRQVFGLDAVDAITEGAPVKLTVDGLAAAEGVVAFAALPTYVGVRTDDAISTVIHGYGGTVVVERHGYAADADGTQDAGQIEQAWQTWPAHAFA